MEQFFKNAGQTGLIFAGLFAAQWFIPYLYLAVCAGGYGVFQIFSRPKTSGEIHDVEMQEINGVFQPNFQNNKSGWQWIAAALALGVNAWVYDHFFRK